MVVRWATEITLAVAEKIAKEHIKRGKLANKKELLNIATNYKKSLLESSIDEVFEADTNQVRPCTSLSHFLNLFTSCGVVQDGSIDLEEWKAGAVNNVAIKSLINPSRSVYAIQETVKRGSGIHPRPS